MGGNKYAGIMLQREIRRQEGRKEGGRVFTKKVEWRGVEQGRAGQDRAVLSRTEQN
jgi:hypothetical protein